MRERERNSATPCGAKEAALPGGDEELPRLVLMLRDGQTCTVEREHVVDETVSRRIERVIDPHTGEARLRTLEFVEKVVEKEVNEEQRAQVASWGTPPPSCRRTLPRWRGWDRMMAGGSHTASGCWWHTPL